jgi:hypothetical protein
MWEWIVQNKAWVFSGAGVTALGVLWWLVTKFWPKREAAISTTQAPSMSIAPVITMSPAINFPIEPRAPEPPKQVAPPAPAVPVAPKPRPNLSIEEIKIGKISLEGDIWTLRPNSRGWERQQRYRALLADISNVPTDETHTANAAIRAAIRMDDGGRQRTYSPLPWLEEFTNMVYLEAGGRKTVVLAVGEDSQIGAWTFVLNHRKDYYTSNTVSEMDWTNQCPKPSGLSFEILMIEMIDMNSGALLVKFAYLWTFDAQNNWPILKTVD